MTEQTILWRRVDQPGHDACSVRETADGWCVQGTALFSLDAQPCHLA